MWIIRLGFMLALAMMTTRVIGAADAAVMVLMGSGPLVIVESSIAIEIELHEDVEATFVQLHAGCQVLLVAELAIAIDVELNEELWMTESESGLGIVVGFVVLELRAVEGIPLLIADESIIIVVEPRTELVTVLAVGLARMASFLVIKDSIAIGVVMLHQQGVMSLSMIAMLRGAIGGAITMLLRAIFRMMSAVIGAIVRFVFAMLGPVMSVISMIS